MHYIDRKGSECILSGCCLTIILAVAAWQDYREYKVKNCIILTGWILGLLFGIYYRGLTGMICFLCNSVISVFILLFLFRFKMMGAGDIKLLSVVSGFMGFSFFIRVLIVSLFIGALVSLVKCFRCGYLINRLSYFRHYISELMIIKVREPYYVRERDGVSVVIPFSLVIAVGYLVVFSGMTKIIGI